MRTNLKHIAVCLLVLMGYYLLPEHYLVAFHPHEHDTHCCSLNSDYDIISPAPTHCPEKENYKLIYDLNPKFFKGFSTIKEIFYQAYTPEEIKTASLFLPKPRAPPGLIGGHL